MLKLRKCRIGVVGLGYVGLPLAVEFGKHFETIGFDVNPARVAQLERGRDVTLEATRAELKSAKRLTFTTELGPPQWYAISGPDGDEMSDRWEEALQLKAEITELFGRIDTGAAV